ncbi:MAG: hypothetical protein ACRCXK_08590 [Wohlfahrtiimonas sp.]
MNKVKTNYKQCAIATLSLWAVYLLVVVIGTSISLYIRITNYEISSETNIFWLEAIFYSGLLLIPSLLVFFVLVRNSASRKNIFVSTSGLFVIVYAIAVQIWMNKIGAKDEFDFVGIVVGSMMLFLLISLYSWIALKIIKYQSK